MIEANDTGSSTRNACKLCAPLGACLAFKGIEGAITLLHGSQGCSTYIRRYMISHFKEPVDIASSNFTESAAVFGGAQSFSTALDNVIRQYRPAMIGIATTCLSETIGDDVESFIRQYQPPPGLPAPELVKVSTASYRGTHSEGFMDSLRAVVEALAQPGTPIGGTPKSAWGCLGGCVRSGHPKADLGVPQEPPGGHINLLPGMVSPADLRYLKELLADFALPATLLSDYSDTLDGGAWSEYQLIPPGGTRLEDLRRMGSALATVEFSSTFEPARTAGAHLEHYCQVPLHRMGLPMGVSRTDDFMALLARLSGRAVPAKHVEERQRLIDSLADAHKYVMEKRAVIYGEEDLVVGLAAMLSETGIVPVLCASGGRSGRMRGALQALAPQLADATVMEGADFADIEQAAGDLKVDLVVGNSKGYAMARRLDRPLVRVGFPIHDRLGAARLLHLGYRGAQQLLDRAANALIEAKQASSPVGYSYM
jgi:nitrogenase molybdenum-iron protein NifN